MFDNQAFRTWGDVLVGAFVVSGLFLSVMLMVEEVVGPGAHFSRAVIVVTAAAFVGYVATAWLIRGEESSES